MTRVLALFLLCLLLALVVLASPSDVGINKVNPPTFLPLPGIMTATVTK